MESNIREIKKSLFKRLLMCYQGWWEWHKIVRRKSVDYTTAVILLPSDNQEYSYYALLHLNAMLPTRGFDSAVILTHDPVVMEAAHLFSDKIRETIFFERKKAERLMQYACLYTFDLRLVIASLEEPSGRKGETLVGKRGLTREEVFAVGVYRIYPEKVEAPVYRGTDQKIRSFLNLRREKKK